MFKSSVHALMLMPVRCTNRSRVHWMNISISASVLDLNHFSNRETKAFAHLCKKCHLTWKILTTLPGEKLDLSLWRSRAWSRYKNTLRGLIAVCIRNVHCAFSIHSVYLLKNQAENKKLSQCIATHHKPVRFKLKIYAALQCSDTEITVGVQCDNTTHTSAVVWMDLQSRKVCGEGT